MKIKYDLDSMRLISLFETLTKANVKDSFELDGTLIFVVDQKYVGMAIGKNGVNVKNLAFKLKKPVKIVGFNEDVCQFVRNFIHPIKADEVKCEEKNIMITGSDTKSKGLIIGRDRKNINNLLSVVKRHFDIEKIEVN